MGRGFTQGYIQRMGCAKDNPQLENIFEIDREPAEYFLLLHSLYRVSILCIVYYVLLRFLFHTI
jgi:hypothetical protein